MQGRPQDLGGGAKNFFFRFRNLHVAKRHAAHSEAIRIARGVRGHALPRNFFLKRCNLCVLECILIRFVFIFLQKLPFLYKKINISDTHLLCGISREEIFENLLRFGVYLETKMAIFIKK